MSTDIAKLKRSYRYYKKLVDENTASNEQIDRFNKVKEQLGENAPKQRVKSQVLSDEEKKQRRHDYYVKNREKIIEYTKKWNKTHQDKVAEYNKKSYDEKKDVPENGD